MNKYYVINTMFFNIIISFNIMANEQFYPPPSEWNFVIKKNSEIMPSEKQLYYRINADKTNKTYADNIVLRINSSITNDLINQLAKPKTIQLWNDPEKRFLLNNWFNKYVKNRIDDNKFTITSTDLFWIDLTKLQNILKRNTLYPYFKFDNEQIGFYKQYFGDDWKNVKTHLKTSKNVAIKDILPNNIKHLYGQYAFLRGRNCFATALDFIIKGASNKPNINVEKEEGHYNSMINNDEFTNALHTYFRELTPQEILSGIRWGDIIAFVDAEEWPSYVAYKHAIVHIGADVYFHKQSKSASSPIEFVDWKSVIGVWQPLVKKLDYHVFRRHSAFEASVQNNNLYIEQIIWKK